MTDAPPTPAARPGAESDLVALIDAYLEEEWRYSPPRAAHAGLHEYDAEIGDRGRAARAAHAERQRALLSRAAAVAARDLSPALQLDREYLLGRLQLALLEHDRIRLWEQDPNEFADQMDLTGLLLRDTGPLAERLAAIAARLERFPDLVADARACITRPQAPFVKLAVQNFTGFASFFRDELGRALGEVRDAALARRLGAARERAATAVLSYAQELERDVLPRATSDFAIGEEALCALLRYGEHVDAELDSLRQTAEEEIERLRERIAAAAAAIAPGATVEEALAAVADGDGASPDLVATAASQLDGLRWFTAERGLATVHPGECVVREAPAFARWNSAYISIPGPFECTSSEGIYFIAPLEPSWSHAEQRAYLRANNRFALHNTTCHEAYPGHYVQTLFQHRAATRLRQVAFCTSTGEGWAHYVEEMLLDGGFADGDPRYRIEQLRDALLRAVRFRCAIGLHAEGWSVEGAEALFRSAALQDPINARQQAVRGTFDPGYLNYTLGKRLIVALRDEVRAREGAHFDLRRFHDRLLAEALPIPLARRALLAQGDGALPHPG